jgi:hypothetical protein
MKWIKTSEQLPQKHKCILGWVTGYWQGNYPATVTWNGDRFSSDTTTRVYDKKLISHWAEIESPEA